MLNKFLSLFGALLLATNAHAVLVDFESDVSVTQITSEPGWPVQGTFTYQLHSQGFSFGNKEDFFGTGFDIGTSPATGNYLSGYTLAQGLLTPNTIWRDDGQLFSVASLDLSGIVPVGYRPCDICNHYTDPVVIHGFDAAGILSKSMAVYAGSTTWQTVTFDASWTNLSAIKIYGQEDQELPWFNVVASPPLTPSLDNFNATVVPIPGAVWLFASALGLMGWRSRKH